MSIDSYLRLMIQSDKEAVITSVDVTGTPAQLFTSQLSSGHTRKAINVINNAVASTSGSGELFYGYTTVMSPSGESMSLTKNERVNIPVASNIDIYFCCDSGEFGNVRVEELA